MADPKVCNRCRLQLEKTCFSKCSNQLDGLQRRCKKCDKELKAIDYANNREAKKKQSYDKYHGDLLKYRQVRKKWRDNNQDKARKAVKSWCQQNPDRVKRTAASHYRRNYKFNTNYTLTRLLRNRLYSALQKNYRCGSAVRDLGCSIEEFKIYLQSKFQDGMSWSNWTTDGWHIDHVTAISRFDLSDPEQLRKACHYTNLQPLWADENIRKGSKI